MPVFNTPEEWLRPAIESVVAQDVSFDIELVVCDDGSEATTVRAIHRAIDGLVRRNPRVQPRVVLPGRHRGVSAARNTAARHSTGAYLLWLDSDDELAPGIVTGLVERARRHNALMVLSRCEVRDGECRDQRNPGEYLRLAKQWHRTDDDPLSQVVFSLQAQLVRAEAFHAVDGFREDYEWAEVTDFFLRFVARHGIRAVRCLPEVGYYYYRRAGSHSTHRAEFESLRERALREYRTAIRPDGSHDADVAIVGRSPRSGAQHYQWTIDGIRHEVPYHQKFFQPQGT
jgi:glycosyltransferase involved in cell wall biosynthesis